MAPVTRLPRPTEFHWDWQRLGSCRGMDVESFFHPDGERGLRRRERDDRAKQVCAGCPVMEPCRAWARQVQEPFGVWGGESEDERQAVIRADRRSGRAIY